MTVSPLFEASMPSWMVWYSLGTSNVAARAEQTNVPNKTMVAAIRYLMA